MVAFELQSAVVSNSTDEIIYKADSSRGYQPLASGFPRPSHAVREVALFRRSQP